MTQSRQVVMTVATYASILGAAWLIAAVDWHAINPTVAPRDPRVRPGAITGSRIRPGYPVAVGG